MPDELSTQIERIREVIEAFNIPVFTAEGYEADDVLATLAHQAETKNVQTIIVTGDRDLLQVVDERISVLTSGRRFSDTIVYTAEAVRERYGLEPRQLIDLKALVGDKSDNIPGVSGVGEKGEPNSCKRGGIWIASTPIWMTLALPVLATPLPNSGMWLTSHELWELLSMSPAWNWT